jgi:hypothetical protein
MRNVAIIGAGPAGLIAAEYLSANGLQVDIFDRMPSVGRKFLMAGRGGLNLTHSENFETFLTRYGAAQSRLQEALKAFTPQDAVSWCEGLGQPTFVGSSGRIFPKAFKASPLLRAWLGRLQSQNVRFHLNHTWTGWNGDQLTFSGTTTTFKADAVLLALGGASWPRLGSRGDWANHLEGIKVVPFAPSNCGLTLAWSDIFENKFAGQPLKSIALSYGERKVQGELMITNTGLEGTPAYTLSPLLRDKQDSVLLDLRPGMDAAALKTKLAVPRKRQSLSTYLQKAAGLSPVAVGCLYEAQSQGQPIPEETGKLAAFIKAVPLKITGTSGIARAISSAGGIALDEINQDFMLIKKHGVYVAGEMIDWEAPTGGYLLQACFSTGVAAAKGILKQLA